MPEGDRKTERLVREFEACTLPTLTHEDHVRVAWHALRHAPFWQVLRDLPGKLQRFAASKGAPNHYHETITFAFLALVHERMQRGSAGSWSEFAAAHPELLRSSLLERYYPKDVVESAFARRVFILPDPNPAP